MRARTQILACLGLVALASRGQAADPSAVSAECRAQVVSALEALGPALAKKARKLMPSAIGTIEGAIAAYAPPRLHPVDEGALPPARAGGRCPPEMAVVAHRFCVDRWEGSLEEKQEDGTTRPWSAFAIPRMDRVYLAKSRAGALPQGYISAQQAAAACGASGKRLCHPVEWRAACGGSEGYAYPYGPARVPGRCKDSGSSPMLAFHASTMSRGWGKTELNDPRNNQLEGGLAKTGASPGCVNDYGVYDMVGNLHEWTADPNGTFQGGYWLDTSQHGEGCAYRTIAHDYGYRDYSTGLRCCQELGR